MEQRRPCKPRHEGRVLDRVPKPKPTPTELVVSPPGAERDAGGEGGPGDKHPRPQPSRPGRIDPTLEQRRHGESVGHGETDIAEVQHRWVHGETGVLKDRVEATPVKRYRENTRERVGGEQHEGEKGAADQPLHRQRPCLEGQGKVTPGDRHSRAEQGQGPNPKQQRSLVIAPCAADSVDEWLCGVTILDDVEKRKVRHDVRVDEGREGKAEEEELPDGGGGCHRLQQAVPSRSTDERQRALNERQAESENKGEMPEFDIHRAVILG